MRTRLQAKNISKSSTFQLQKSLSNSDNERRVLAERLDSSQQVVAELRRNNHILQDQLSRLNNELANNEVQRAGLESQLRLAQWPADGTTVSHQSDDLLRQLQIVQRERNDMKGKVDSLNNKVSLDSSKTQRLPLHFR